MQSSLRTGAPACSADTSLTLTTEERAAEVVQANNALILYPHSQGSLVTYGARHRGQRAVLVCTCFSPLTPLRPWLGIPEVRRKQGLPQRILGGSLVAEAAIPRKASEVAGCEEGEDARLRARAYTFKVLYTSI